MPEISVVIPCHNYGRFLADAVESVLAQSGCDLEVIVIDDGSTDNTAAVAARYADVRLVREEQLGQAGASNRGLEEARSALVLFLDADDVLLPGALESSIRCFRRRPDCAFVYGHQQFITGDGSLITDRPDRDARVQRCLDGDPYAYMLRMNHPLRGPGAIIYRRDVIQQIGGFVTDVGNCQDIDLNLRIAREYAICCNDRIVLSSRIHGGNATLARIGMLRGAVRAQKHQGGFVAAHPRYRDDYGAGLSLARSYWGEAVARQIVADIRAVRLVPVVRGLAVLCRYAPRVGARTLLRSVARF